MKEYDVVIVGAGISGSSLAYYCAGAGLKTALIEKSAEAGGSLTSAKFTSSGNWLELGAHTCYSSYQNLLDIVDGCVLSGEMIPRAKVPFSLMIDGQIRSIVSQLSIFELLVSAPNFFKLKKEGQSVKSYYSRIVGERNYQDVVRHFFNAVPSQPTDDFPADMMFKSREKRKGVLKNYTFRNGLQSVAQAITAQRGIDLFVGTEVRSVAFGREG